MMNIVLTGFMGTGKTAVGRELARLSGMRFIDIDQEIEREEGMSITEIFSQKGEAYFRDLETAAIRKFSDLDGIVLSTGGGAVLREENLSLLRRQGRIFCLTAHPETILARTGHSEERPLLAGEDRYERIRGLLAARQSRYETAGTMIDTENRTPLQIAEAILRMAA